MPKLSYGPAAKARVAALFAALIDYGNDAVEADEAQLERLRSHITSHWQGDRTLIVRTKLRYLQLLTQLACDQPPLTAAQIKDCLKYLEQFLGILQDNRTSRRGSDVWHFTLTLWRSRWDRGENLHQFDQQWQARRTAQPSANIPHALASAPKQVKSLAANAGRGDGTEPRATPADQVTPNQLTFWRDLIQRDLINRRHTNLTTNPLTAQTGQKLTVDQIYVPLGLVEEPYSSAPQIVEQTVEPAHFPPNAEISATYPTIFASPTDFFTQIWHQPDGAIAIIGEPGAGKTTLLQRLAQWLLAATQAIPIWVSLADIGTQSLEDYLLHTWLRQALGQLSVPSEILEHFAQIVTTGPVWLLLDAVDEMALAASAALAWVAKQLQGWLAPARVVLTCRQNVWQSGHNALTDCRVYRCCRFGTGQDGQPDQIHQFIQGWFQAQPQLAQQLQTELGRSHRRRLREIVTNPLQLALLCHTWTLTQGQLPTTKYRLYRQFVESLHLWKQDCFPTSRSQQHQLQQGLGELAIATLGSPHHRRRIPHRLVHHIFAQRDLQLLDLALQLGWLQRIIPDGSAGVEPLYAFSHETFQAYFAAQGIADSSLFFDGIPSEPANSADPPNRVVRKMGWFTRAAVTPPHFSDRSNSMDTPAICAPHWQECILLWMGREDIALMAKEAFIQALVEFNDHCGGFFSQRAYFLAAIALAECPDCRQSQTIIAQLVRWGFQTQVIVPTPLRDGARHALSRTDRSQAIAALETFVSTTPNPFDQWIAAYSLGKNYDFGNAVAIATLETLLETLRNPHLRINVARSLGTIQPRHPQAIATLTTLLTQDNTPQFTCKVALRLGQIDPGNEAAIATLGQQLTSLPPGFARQCAQDALGAIAPHHPQLALVSPTLPSRPRRRRRRQVPPNPAPMIAATLERLATTSQPAARLRLAKRLWGYHPGHPVAIAVTLDCLRHSQHKSTLKQAIALLQTLPAEQLAMPLPAVGKIYRDTQNPEAHAPQPLAKIEQERSRLCYQLLGHWADRLGYKEFRQLWQAVPIDETTHEEPN